MGAGKACKGLIKGKTDHREANDDEALAAKGLETGIPSSGAGWCAPAAQPC
jgi:hypothetical protein